MILVTLGTQKFPMNRLVEAADKLAEQVEEEVFVQTGNSTYVPSHCKHSAFVDRVEFKKMIEGCSVLVTHAGVGSIMTGINAGRPVVCVPRLPEYGEHVDDHQQQIAEAFGGKNCVLYCEDLDRLEEYVEKARTHEFTPYVVHGGKIEDIILKFMDIFD